ncbi:hypothetical protein A6A19_00320 [Actinobacillus delphinicola]|uniref:single-stranded DNA-binding protein n=1 Tax=Actinobacillus delphinicola TaxID=51161 RepID=UPI0024416E0E|nr:single-stranded DNA-binding protein [Actinobacillus delphinicola]MDG6896490.1 hypothetical protein [Actinobacillus delphinicola]
MFSFNQVIVLGNVGKNPEIQTLPNNGLVATFSIATVNSYKDSEGNWQQKTDWHTIKAFMGIAEIIQKHVKRGNKIQVIGQIKNNNYEKDGIMHYSYYIRAEKIVILNTQSNGSNSHKNYDEFPVNDNDIIPIDEVTY